MPPKSETKRGVVASKPEIKQKATAPKIAFVVTCTSTHKGEHENVAVFSTEKLAKAWIEKHQDYYGGGLDDDYGLGLENYIIDEAPNPENE